MNRSNISNLSEGVQQGALPGPMVIALSVVYGVLFVFGLAGNTFVIVFSAINKKNWNNMTYLYINLSVADLLTLFVSLPLALIELHTNDAWHFGEALCK